MVQYGNNSPNLLCICVNQKCDEDYSGVIWHQYGDKPIVYHTLMELLKDMEKLYDLWDFPQRSTMERTFKETAKGQKRRDSQAKRDIRYAKRRRVMDKKGEMGTFLIRVKYRQNSTWQGEIAWLEHEEKKCFRSALELMKLIDSAVCSDESFEAERFGW